MTDEIEDHIMHDADEKEEMLCRESFEETLKEYELDTGLSIEEIFYEMYAAGFYTGMAMEELLEEDINVTEEIMSITTTDTDPERNEAIHTTPIEEYDENGEHPIKTT